MAADTNATIVRVRAVVEGLPGLNQLKTAMRGISAESKSANVDLRLVNAQLRNLGVETNKSINNLRLQKQAFEAVRNSARIGSEAYKEATLQLKQLNRELDKTQAGGGGGRGRNLAAIGTVAGAGVFGGPEGAIGAGIGLALGGPAGAAAGAGIGVTVSGFRQQAAGIAEYAKELNLAKITLAQASTGQADFNQNLQIARQISTDYSVGLRETVSGYAQVSVAARANGLTVQQTEAIYRGVISASVAFGKSQEDLDAIVRATVQVLSKGKVSAEEMGGQIGERLPGAVAKFAQATGRSLPELAKDFEQGKVTIADFVKFTEKQVNDYDEIAKIIGASPEKAGARLKLALDTAAENYGGFFQNIGAGMQDNLAKMLSWVNQNSVFIKRYATFWVNLGRDIKRAIGSIAGVFFGFGKGIFRLFTDVASFVPRKIAAAFRTTPEKIFGKLTSGVQGALAEYTKNYADYFSEFKVPEGAFGTNQGDPSGDLAAEEDKVKKKAAAKIPVTRIGDMLSQSKLGVESAKISLRVQERINLAKKEGNEYDAEVLPLVEGLLQKSTKIKEEEEKLGDLIQNKNILIKQGMSMQEWTARYELAASNVEEGRLARQKDFLKFQQQEAEISKRMDAEKSAAYQTIQAILTDSKIKTLDLSEEDRRRLEINKTLAEVIDRVYGKLTNEELLNAIRELRKNLQDAADAGKDFGSKLGKSFAEVVKASGELAQNLGASLGNAFLGLGDQLAEFVTTGKANFADFARSVLNDLSRILIQFAMFQTLKALVPSGSAFGKFLGFANGGIMTGNGALPLKRYAAGGIASSPQLAMFGEGSRPEAYVPLPDGRTIPVTMRGGGDMGNVVVNVDASGSSVEGNQPDAAQLGRAIGAAVQAELIKQKRPGGLLS